MNNALMAPRKNKRSEASKAIAQSIIDQYKPTSAKEMQDALKDIFGPMFEAKFIEVYSARHQRHKIENATMNFYDHCCKKSMFPGGLEPSTAP